MLEGSANFSSMHREDFINSAPRQVHHESTEREVRDREEDEPANSEITRGSPHLRLRKGRSAPRKDDWDSGFAQTQSYLKAEMGSPGLLQPKQAV